MIRKSKNFVWPRKLYQKDRIQAENNLMKKYGLKNKREIWRTEAQVNYLRARAKKLVNLSREEQEIFIMNLKNLGLNVNSLTEVLALKVEDLLKRNLISIVVSKNLANTHRQARQMISHKKIIVGDKMVGSPRYIVKVGEEDRIKVKDKIKKSGEKTNQKDIELMEGGADERN